METGAEEGEISFLRHLRWMHGAEESAGGGAPHHTRCHAVGASRRASSSSCGVQTCDRPGVRSANRVTTPKRRTPIKAIGFNAFGA